MTQLLLKYILYNSEHFIVYIFVKGNYSEKGINDKVIGYRINIDAYIISIIMDT